jgi:hypothetical protein
VETAETQSRDAATLRRELNFYTEAEVAALRGVSVGRARNRRSEGDWAPHYKVGAQKLYAVSEVMAWIKRQRRSKAA